MKKICALVLALLLIQGAALAADLSGMSFDELLALRDQVQRELISRPEWKEVTVPAGTWYIGPEIPEGIYSLYPSTQRGATVHLWGKAKDDFETDGGLIISVFLQNQEVGYGKVELKEGNVLILGGPVVLSPVQPLGF